jgi:hypothetical protein
MTLTLKDIRDAVSDAVTNVTVKVTSTGVPSGEQEFNFDEKVTYSITITNPSDGAQLKNVRVHVSTSDVKQMALITPPTTTATAYEAATGTDTWNVGDGHTYMYLSKPELSVLAPGDVVTISPLTVLSFKIASSPVVSAHIHGIVDMDWLIPPGDTGTNGTKTFTIVKQTT